MQAIKRHIYKRVMSWLLLYILTTTLLTCGAQEYYVTPTPPPNPNCPSDKPCHTLDYYAEIVSGLINGRENVSLLFMSGYHTSETIFEVVDVDIFTIAGLDSNFSVEIPSITIALTQMLISNGTVFTLKNIAISSTLLNVSNFQGMINYKTICDNSLITLIATQVDSVLLTNSRLQQCIWSLYWGYNNETAAVGVSTKADQKIPIVEISNTSVSSESVINIGLVRNSSTSMHLNITFCSFVNTNGLIITAHTVGQPLPESDLVIRMDHCSMIDDVFGTMIHANGTHNVHVHISDSHFAAFATGSKTVILSSSIGSTINATVEGNNFMGRQGINTSATGQSMLSLTIRKCNFMKASLYSIRMVTNRGMINALIEECLFKDGFNEDLDLHLQDRVILVQALTSEDNLQVVLRNSLVVNNHFVTGILILLGPAHMTIEDSTIKGNSGIVSGGLLSINSNITLMGNTVFENNTGSAGSAMYLVESLLTFTKNLSLVFRNNRAESTGGAIFVAEAGAPTFGDDIIQFFTNLNPKCFYQLETDEIYNSSPQPTITFTNNTAQTAGNNIYGAGLKDICTVTPNRVTPSYTIQESLFYFQTRSQSSVSSSPRRVCACENGKPKCADMDYIFINRSVTPGERFSIEAILVGFDFGATTGGIFATELQNATDNKTSLNSLGKGEEIQLLNSKNSCTTIHYSIRGEIDTNTTILVTSSRFNAETISLALNLLFTQDLILKSIQEYEKFGVITTTLQFTPIFIAVHLLPCSIGLEIDENNQTCECNSELKEIATNCTVENGRTMITRNINQRSWLRIHNDSNSEILFEYAFQCSYAFCNLTVLDIDPSNPDSQCAHNHSGVLCGGCAEGLSLAIGSSRCLECPNNSNVWLILVFLLLGIVLVLFIWILDLTISRGTINGLLFYVNMVSIHREIFFVENTGLDDTLNNSLKAAQWFVDWCNLDFGIESCFIFELTAMGKVWLQFLFPLYVWSLAGLIIVACKYSTRLTKLFGNNSVSVLLTLFFIAYMKLVQTIIASFTYSNIRYLESDSFTMVWLVDGNVRYEETVHIILCLVSGIVAICLVTITVLLIFIKYTSKLPQHYKFVPIFDSFTRQLKNNHEYWIGLSLLTRVGFAIGTMSQQHDTILRVLVVVLFLLSFLLPQVYKKTYLTLLEFTFLTNLLVLSAIFVAETNNQTLAISISVSVLISALMFFGICIYHGIKFAKRTRPRIAKYLRELREAKRKIKETESKQQNIEMKSPTLTVVNINGGDTEVPSSLNKNIRRVPDYSKYREELLDSTTI